jgi:PPM family protein phosphatase
MLQFRHAALSDVGCVRTNNEDSGFAGPYLVMVADGVGGAAAGEVASSTVTYVASALSMLPSPDQPVDPGALLADAVRRSNDQLRQGVADDAARHGMGTTFTAVYTDGERCVLGHVGDSRAYLLRSGELIRLSIDHTLVQALVDAGRLTPEEARVSPQRNVVLRALGGGSDDAEPDLLELGLKEGDRLLLCSDGLTDLVGDAEIADLLRGHAAQPAVEALVAAALREGGKDNVTCVVADVVDGPPVDSRGQLVGAVTDLTHVVDPVAVR